MSSRAWSLPIQQRRRWCGTRCFGPAAIHVVHFVIDGGVRSAKRPEPEDRPDSPLNPDDIAHTYVAALAQPRSAWSSEIEVRPWVKKF